MGKLISDADYKRMEQAYNGEIAAFIAENARKTGLLTYGDLARRFGGIARGYGNRLGGITIFCRDHNLPLLPVVVVNKKTKRPSAGALLYRDFGLEDDAAIDNEQRKVKTFDWTRVAF